MDLLRSIKDKLSKGDEDKSNRKEGGEKKGSSGSTPDPDAIDPEDLQRLRHFRRMGFGMDGDDEDDDILDNMSPGEKRRMLRMMHRGDMRMMMRMMGDPFHDPWARPHHSSSRETSEAEKASIQRNWNLPPLVDPDPTEEEQQQEGEVMEQDHGDLTTDAQLYTIVEGEGEAAQHHTILKMPSEMPESLAEGRLPTTTSTNNQDAHTFNILMADSSGSMGSYWDKLLEGWNKHVAPVLKGRTSIYTFSKDVRFIRSGTKIETGDIDHSMTNLTGALQKMADEIYTCKEKYVKVFLVTDGDHNVTTVQPDMVLQKLMAPCTKVVDMFVLGAGNGFPVKYSITLRSQLHNGSSNLPSLFWAKNPPEMDEQLKSIAGCISSGVSRSLTLSKAGFSLPGTVPKNTFHLNEFVYFPSGPDQVKQLTLTRASHIGHISLEARSISVRVLMDVFRQWNSILIQLHTKKESMPPNPLEFMEKLFNAANKPAAAANSIRARIAKKETATQELDFQTLKNKVKAVLTSSKFSNELELAENILSTTVSGGKYETKVLQLKGHTDQDYQDDITEFLKVADSQKDVIMSLNMTPDDSCRITMTSTLQDLQDPDLHELKTLNKFEFLKQFTISGIGVCAPMRDSVTINPWSFGVKAILGQPYTIVSQVAMENFASNTMLTGHDKEVQLKHDDENTRFNAVVPVFPPEAAKVMEPIVKTRLYSMCTTFAILKNPHVVDFNIHFAALGVTWVRLLHEFPTVPRPEYVQRHIQSIEATADLYVRRAGHQNFWQMLKDKPHQALMTESKEEINERTMKCESLIKPMFILHLQQRQQQLDPSTLSPIIKLMLLEYVGRCLAHYKAHQKDATPFTDFFAEDLTDETRRQQWADRYLADVQTQMEAVSEYQLKDYYTLEKVMKAAKRQAGKKMGEIRKSFTEGINIVVNTTKVLNLRNVSSAGDVSLPTLRTFVNDIGLPQQTVEELFSDQNLMIYTVHALEYRSSRERLDKPMPTYEQAVQKATEFVQKENSALIGRELRKKLVELLTKGWVEAYKAAHCDVVQPMSQQQIVAEAQQRGVEVTETTFNQVYKRYRADVGLMGNACQSPACPFFLIPDCRYNQHAIVERKNHPTFPHTFHRSAYKHRNDELPVVISNLTNGTHSRSHAIIPQQIINPLLDLLATLKILYQRGTMAH